MNREIKFRAWEPVEKIMWGADHLSDELAITFMGAVREKEEQTFAGERYDEWLLADDQKYILMQYTGLKDKNGVEIYEGDIYITLFAEKVGKKLGIQIDSPTNVVTWNRCGFSPLENEEYITVIGNIYENPELLK